MRVLVVGSINMDIVMETGKIPKPGETVTGRGLSLICGGKGANQATAAAKLGAEVKMIGAVGNDVFGKQLIQNLQSNAVGTEGVQVCGSTSGIAVITVCNGENSIMLEPGANNAVNRELIDKNIKLLAWADIIIMQFEIPIDTVIYVAETAKRLNKRIVVNPAPYRQCPDRLFQLADIYVPNEHEAASLLGYEITEQTAEKAVRSISDKGCKQVIITLGEKGCVYSSDGCVKSFGIYKTKAEDTTAAGDSFIASLCISESEGKSIDEAVSFAAKVAAITVSRKGAGVSIPSRSEAERTEMDYMPPNVIN